MHYTNNYHNYSTPQTNLMPFQTQFETALRDPNIVQKCNILSQLIRESLTTNPKDIQMHYTALVDDIFGTGLHALSTDWSLKHIDAMRQFREYSVIHDFLHPEGCLFQLIRHLMTDPLNRYDFPKTLLPLPTKLSLEEGVIPSFYVNKMSHVLSHTISLNAFEYFIFQFAYHMLNTTPKNFTSRQAEQLFSQNTDAAQIAYFKLLEEYLIYFVPISSKYTPSNQNTSPQSSLWQSLSSTTSTLLHLRTPIASQAATPPKSPAQTPTLFKSSFLKPLISGMPEHTKSPQMTDRPIHDSLGSEIAKCESFLLILTELWLNHAVPPSAKPRSSPSKQCSFTPNSDHMKAVRILVKHLHYFANSCPKGRDPNILDVSPLDDVKQSIWSPKYVFQKKLYTFMRLSFDRWPNDHSFRLPLETWLSFIQPWRYLTPGDTSSMSEDKSDRQLQPISDEWMPFISDNLLFYTVIFRQLIPRFPRLDLSSQKNAFMLSRLTKVFSRPRLSALISEAEKSLMSSDTSMSHLLSPTGFGPNSRPSLLSPNITQQRSLSTPFRHPLMELEAKNFEYIPLFCPAIRPLIQRILIEISRVMNGINQTISKVQLNQQMSPSGLTFFQTIGSFFSFSEESAESQDNRLLIMDKQKALRHLQTSAEQLSELFDVPLHELHEMQSSLDQRLESPEDSLFGEKAQEIFEEKDGTLRLTSYGRSQVLNRTFKPQLNLIEGNPDRQPVRTFEFYYLVQLSLWISDWINGRYGQTLESMYSKSGFLGVFYRQLITGPTRYMRTVRADNSYRVPDRVAEVLGPRVCLRFVASKVFLLWTLLIYAIVFFFKFSLIYFSSLLIAMFFTYLITKSFLIYMSGK